MIKKIFLAAALACVVPGVLSADSTVSMQLTAPPAGPYLGGVYISPYTALIGPSGQSASYPNFINGTSTPVICDDFTTDVSVTGTPAWQATVTSLQSVVNETSLNTTVKFTSGVGGLSQQTGYAAAAILANEIMQAQAEGAAGLQLEGDLSYALWGLFDSAAGGPLSGAYVTGIDLSNAQAELAAAIAAAETPNATDLAYIADTTIYTPNASNVNGKNASQEYIVVNTPEPSTLLMLVLGIGGLLMFWRRQRNAAVLAA